MRTKQSEILAHTSRTATVTTAIPMEDGIESLQFDIDVSAITSTPVITPTFEYYDETNGLWVILHTGDVIDTDEQHETIRLGPLMPTVAENTFLSYIKPGQWRLVMTAADADACVYGVNLIKFFRT